MEPARKFFVILKKIRRTPNQQTQVTMHTPKALHILAVVAAAMLTACTGSHRRPTLAVSVEPQRALLQEIVGDKYQVVTLLSNGANPESFDPTIKTRTDVDNADIYFTTGFLPFEKGIAETLNPEVKVADTSAGITPIYGTHSHHHDGEAAEHLHDSNEADPHTWASVRNARTIAANMAREVMAVDPANAEFYRANLARLTSRLDSLDAAITAKMASAASRAFAVWHPSLSYFARDYGLQQLSVGFENKEVSPRQMARVTDEAREHGVRVFFFQADYDSRQAATLNKAMGTRMVTINPLAYDWEAELTKVADELTK